MNRHLLPCLLVTLGLTVTAFARAERRVEKTLKLEPGGRLAVETEMGSVSVTGVASPDVHVVVTSKGRDLEKLLTLRFEEGTRSARITGRRKSYFFGWFDGDRVHFEIQVPTVTALDLDTSGGGLTVASIRSRVKLHTSGGSIDVRDVVGDLDGHTSGGGVHVKNIRGITRVETSGGSIDGADLDGPVDADTSGGGITVKRVTGDLKVHSSGGSIQIDEAGGHVDADTSGGGVRASFARGNSRGGRLESSGGSIQVSLDTNADLEIDASASHVSTDLPLKVRGELSRRHIQGTLGKGGASLRLHTSGGGIRIQAL